MCGRASGCRNESVPIGSVREIERGGERERDSGSGKEGWRARHSLKSVVPCGGVVSPGVEIGQTGAALLSTTDAGRRFG